jgi:hypothetical protein
MKNQLPLPETYGVACERIRCLCALYDASVTSNLRTELRNSLPRIKGSPNSKHQISFGGCGWDLVPDQWTERRPMAQAARKLGFKVQVEDDHVHLQSLPPTEGSVF